MESSIVTQTQQMGNQEVTVTTHFDFNWDHVHFSVKVRTFRRRSINPHQPQHYHHHSPQLLSYQKYETIMSDHDFENHAKYVGIEMTAYGFYKSLSNALKGNPSVKFHYYQDHSNNTVTLAVAQGMVTIPMKMGELQDIITPTTSANNLENLSQTQVESQPQVQIWRNPHQESFYLNNLKNAVQSSAPVSAVDERLSVLTEDLARHKSQYETKILVIENQLSSMVQRFNALERTLSDLRGEMMEELDQKIANIKSKCPAFMAAPTSVPTSGSQSTASSRNIQITKSKKQDLEPVLSTRSNSFYLSDFEEDKENHLGNAPWKDSESEQSEPFNTISSPAIGSNVQIQNRDFVKKYADVIENSPYGHQIDLLKLWYYDTYKEYLVILSQSEKYTLALTYNNMYGNCGGRVFLIHNYGGHVPEFSLHYYRCLESHNSLKSTEGIRESQGVGNFGERRYNPLMKRLADLDTEYEGRLSSRMTAIRYYTALEKIISAHFQ